MPTPRKWAVCLLLAAAAVGGAFPLYQEEVWFGSGPPTVTLWTGAFRGLDIFCEVVVFPGFWALPALAVAAAACTAAGRLRPASGCLLLLLSLGLLLRVAGPYLLKNEEVFRGHVVSGPLPLFYAAAAASGIALIVILAGQRGFVAERNPRSSGL